MSRTVKWLAGFGLAVILAVMGFAIFEPIQVLPRIRLGPGFAFVSQNGGLVTSEDGKGAVTLYSFLPADCGEDCEAVHRTLAEVAARSESTGLETGTLRLVTVALDTDDPQSLRAAAERSGADGTEWQWVGADTDVLEQIVGSGFRVYFESVGGQIEFDPKYVIIDGEGIVRGEYTYATLAEDADRLTRHLSLLGAEIANADGNTALLYEAAHVFLCYP